jgi:RNA polymerase sigma factor for flagellar operon FliA
MNNIQENDLVKKYIDIAKGVARSYSTVTPDHISFDDLFSAGLIGILNSIRSGKTRCVKARVVWAIKEELRRCDFVDKQKRKKINDIEIAKDKLFVKLGRYPKDIEIAEEVGMSFDEYNKFILMHQDYRLYDELEDVVVEDEVFYDGIFAREIIERANLSERELDLLKLFYIDGYTLVEVGKQIGVKEARVCQIRQSILKKISKATSVDEVA